MIPLEVYKEKDTRRTMLCVAYMPQRGLLRLFRTQICICTMEIMLYDVAKEVLV